MAYTKTVWTNGSTPINETNLNKIEDELETLDKRNIYSTTERVIGEWIDGKPLYEKTIAVTTALTSGVNYVSHNIANIDMILINQGKSFMFNSTTGVSYPFPINQYATATDYDKVGITANRNNIQFLVETNWNTDWTKYVTLNYTKTSD